MSDIADFPLIWRWTSATHALFTAKELADLHPLSDIAAARVCDEAARFEDRNGLNAELFDNVLNHSADIPVADGCIWLRTQNGRLEEQVTISWDRHTALRTSWDFFSARWDDFCYPLSDDVLVLPDIANWVLRYHHEEIFYFGNLRH